MDPKPEHNTAPKVINGRIDGRFAKGFSGNPGGSPEATRRAFNKRFLLDLAEDWQQHGREVFKRVRRESPAAYLKVCAMRARERGSGPPAVIYVPDALKRCPLCHTRCT